MFFPVYPLVFIIFLFLSFYIFWSLRFKKNLTKRVEILTYHRVSDDFDWGITRQRVSQFERGIKFLHDQGYKTVSLEEVFGPKQDFEKRVVITFDDGYEDIYLNAFPILRKYGFTAFIFVITGFVGKYNSWDFNFGRKRKRHLSWKQIKEMSKFGFGSHTVNHPNLTKIDPHGVEYELKKSKEVLEDKLGKEVAFLSYPFGRYNRFVQEEAERLGYKRAYTLVPKSKEDGFQSRQRRDFQPFAVGRLGIYLFDSPLTLRVKLNRSSLFWIEDLKGRIINRFASGTAILKGSPDYSRINEAKKIVPSSP
jgi:peptidoglycan/xylan/chitin deacetylase (PgdA/CDA1 family)